MNGRFLLGRSAFLAAVAGNDILAFLRRFHDLHALNQAADVQLNIRNHIFKHDEGFVFVFGHGVLLTECAVANALPQLVHCVDVIHPLIINGFQDDHAFKILQHFRAQLFGARFQMCRRLFVEHRRDLGFVKLGNIFGGQPVVRQDGVQFLQHGGQIPFLGVIADVAVMPDDVVNGGFQHEKHLLMQVFAGKHVLALLVDKLALLIHYIVVFQHVFADFKVARFDLLLGGFDGLADHLHLNRH